MKRNGFTLVELLAVIIIIGVLSLITVPVVDNVIKSSKQSAHDEQLELILSAAKEWGSKHMMSLPADEGDTTTVTISVLKTSGLIDVNLKSPVNDKCFSNDTVIVITRKNNNYVYNFDGDIEYSDTCEVEDGE